MSILVLGSFMMDQVVSTPRAPKNGETIIGDSFSIYPGGKGANQAVSASRLGGDVSMAGKVGEDKYGEDFLQILNEEGINTGFIEKDSRYATGVGFVTSEHNGNNRIVVVPGANLKYNKKELLKLNNILDNIDILIIQLEMDISVMEEAVKMAKEKSIEVILNPAPGQLLEDSLLKHVDYLTPNETELEILTGMEVNTLDNIIEAAKRLLNKNVNNIIVTLGSKGALIVNQELIEHIEGFNVSARDTVAAGDAFNGALSVAITEGKPLSEAVLLANAAGALTVTKKGAIPSIPYREDVEQLLKSENRI